MTLPGVGPGTQRIADLLRMRVNRTLQRIEKKHLELLEEHLYSTYYSLVEQLKKSYPDALADVQGKSAAWARARATILAEELRLTRLAAEGTVLASAFEASAAAIEAAGLMLDVYEPGLGRQLLESTSVNTLSASAAAREMAAHLHRYDELYIDRAKKSVIGSLLRGEGVGKATTRLRKLTGQTRYEAERVVRTELHQAHDLALRESYAQTGVEYVQRVAVMDDRVCEYCAERAGNVYPVTEAPASLHPHDRCYNLPWKPEWAEWGIVDEDWIQKHKKETVDRLRDAGKKPREGRAPFERMNDLEVPTPVWTPAAPIFVPPLVSPIKAAAIASVSGSAGPSIASSPGVPGGTFPAPSPAAPALTEDMVMHQLLGGPRGSNAGGFYRGADGVERYVKFYDDSAQAYGEHLANQLYKELGLQAPESVVFTLKDGRTGYASVVIQNAKTLEQVGLTKPRADAVLRGFGADVLTGNWDAVGMSLDNILIQGKNAIRIDNGGSFLMRARAGRKPVDLLTQATELKAFLDPARNPAYARVAHQAGIYAVDDLGNRFITHVDQIIKLRNSYGGWEAFLSRHAAGLAAGDRQLILEMLEARTKLLQGERRRVRRLLNAAKARRASQPTAGDLPPGAQPLDWSAGHGQQLAQDWNPRSFDRSKAVDRTGNSYRSVGASQEVMADADYMTSNWVSYYSTDDYHIRMRREVVGLLEGRGSGAGGGNYVEFKSLERVLSTRKARWEALSSELNVPFPSTFRAYRGVRGEVYLEDVYQAWKSGADEMRVRSHELASWSLKNPFGGDVLFDVDLPFANTLFDQMLDDAGLNHILREHEVVSMTAKPDQLIQQTRRVTVKWNGRTYGWDQRAAFIRDWEASKGRF